MRLQNHSTGSRPAGQSGGHGSGACAAACRRSCARIPRQRGGRGPARSTGAGRDRWWRAVRSRPPRAGDRRRGRDRRTCRSPRPASLSAALQRLVPELPAERSRMPARSYSRVAPVGFSASTLSSSAGCPAGGSRRAVRSSAGRSRGGARGADGQVADHRGVRSEETWARQRVAPTTPFTSGEREIHSRVGNRSSGLLQLGRRVLLERREVSPSARRSPRRARRAGCLSLPSSNVRTLDPPGRQGAGGRPELDPHRAGTCARTLAERLESTTGWLVAGEGATDAAAPAWTRARAQLLADRRSHTLIPRPQRCERRTDLLDLAGVRSRRSKVTWHDRRAVRTEEQEVGEGRIPGPARSGRRGPPQRRPWLPISAAVTCVHDPGDRRGRRPRDAAADREAFPAHRRAAPSTHPARGADPDRRGTDHPRDPLAERVVQLERQGHVVEAGGGARTERLRLAQLISNPTPGSTSGATRSSERRGTRSRIAWSAEAPRRRLNASDSVPISDRARVERSRGEALGHDRQVGPPRGCVAQHAGVAEVVVELRTLDGAYQ